MGSHSSKSQVPSARATGRHSALPQDVQPYLGPSLECLVVSVPVQMSSHFVSGFSAGATAATSNVDTYYPMIAGYFGQGFTLQTFYRVPGATSVSGFTSQQVPFEAVFWRPTVAPPESTTHPSTTRLLVEKSTMHVQQLRGGTLSLSTPVGTVANTSDIMNKIYQHSSQGGRLICVEINGQAVTQGVSASMAGVSQGIGVDVLFQVPIQPSPVRYVYQCINVPIGVRPLAFGRVTVTCDWFGTLAYYLNQGWKLVEIFLDQSEQRASGFSTKSSMNSIWFFEKDASKLEDLSPVYEGTVVEYFHKVSMSFGVAKVKTDWSGVINEMGSRGWELACILETPEVYQVGFGKTEMKLMMFFQRRIISQVSMAPPPYPGQGQPPSTQPPYPAGQGQPPSTQPPYPAGQGQPPSTQPQYPAGQGQPPSAKPPYPQDQPPSSQPPYPAGQGQPPSAKPPYPAGQDQPPSSQPPYPGSDQPPSSQPPSSQPPYPGPDQPPSSEPPYPGPDQPPAS